MARLIVGLYAPSAGRIEFRGRRMPMIFQDPYASLNPRCPKRFERCVLERPALLDAGTSRAACWLHALS